VTLKKLTKKLDALTKRAASLLQANWGAKVIPIVTADKPLHQEP